MILLHVGMSGSGKTYCLMREVERRFREPGGPFVVHDRMREWATGLRDLTVLRVTTTTDVEVGVREGARVIVYEPPRAVPGASVDGARETTERLAHVVAGSRGVLVLPEAHLSAPEGRPVAPVLGELLTAYRHYGASVWLDTQRVAALSKRATEQATRIRWFALAGRRDLEVARDYGGDRLALACSRAALRLAHGEPGWHVDLDARMRGAETMVLQRTENAG